MTDFFDEHFRQAKLDRRDARTAPEVDFLTRFLRSGASVLDTCCGTGRHSLELARRGYAVTAVDTNSRYIAVARARAAVEHLPIDFAVAPVEDLRLQRKFDLAINMFTSFGYGDEHQNRRFLEAIERQLASGGRFVIEILNRDWRAARPYEARVKRLDDVEVVKEYVFDVLSSTQTMIWGYLRGDAVVHRATLVHRLYSLHELRQLLTEVGLTYEGAYSDFVGTRFQATSKNMIVVAVRN